MKDLINKIKEVESLTKEKFKKWQDENKSLISKHLKEICELDGNLHLEINDSIINHESIILSFRKKPSLFKYNEDDLYNRQESLKGWIFETGGYLAFSITIMGNISAWMKLPEIESIMKNNEEYMDLGFIEQEDLKNEWVIEMVGKFFEIILKWKQGKLFDREPIGFRR